jgi:hypothetical protein
MGALTRRLLLAGDKIVDAAPAAPADARPSISFADQWEKAGLTETLQNSANLVPAVQQYEICELKAGARCIDPH